MIHTQDASPLEDPAEVSRIRIRAHRAWLRASGRLLVSTDLPRDLMAQIDRVKKERGAHSRAPIIEQALRFYLEKQQGP